MDAQEDSLDLERTLKLNLRVLRWRDRLDEDDPAMLALELAQVGRAHDAIELLDEALTRHPEDVDLLLSCGLAARRAGQLAFAEWSLLRAARGAPSWDAPWSVLVEVLETRGKGRSAMRAAHRAVQLGAQDGELVKKVRADERNRALDARIARAENEPESEDPALLARALLDAKRWSDALRVVRLAEEDADLALIAGEAHLALEQRTEADRCFRRAAKLAPDWAEPAVRMALLSPGLGEDDVDAQVDGLLSTLDTVDPIGDATRARIQADDSSERASRARPQSARGGTFLPRLVQRLFGTSVAPSLVARPDHPIA